MSQIELRKHSKYFFLVSFIGLIGLSLILIWPFITALLGSMLLAYTFYPIYRRALKIIKNKPLCSFLMSLFIVILIFVPLMFTANAVLNETNDIFFSLRDFNFNNIDEKYLSKYFGENIDLASYTKDLLNKISIIVLQSVEGFILSLPQKIISLFVMLFVMYYLFKDGKRLVNWIKEELPLKERYRKDIAKKFDNTIYATIYGVIVTALIQGVLGLIGFYIFGIKSPILWGIVMTICAMIPFVGTTIIWLPASIFKLIQGETFNGIGLFLYGLLIISTIDNIIKPKLIGGKGKIHPALVLLGVLGGLKVFGLIGVIIGPLALAILVVFFELYKSEKYEAEN